MRTAYLHIVCIAIICSFVLGPTSLNLESPEEDQAPVLSKTAAASNLTAVIGTLRDEVSNSSFYELDASDSTVDDGSIVNYTWELKLGDETYYLWAKRDSYMFSVVGLYKITLTVMDNESNTASAFTAVYSVEDLDKDRLPDWWEVFYFESRNLTAQSDGDDFDDDGYNNFEEYAMGTNPTDPDPQPSIWQMLMDNWYYLVAIAAVIVAIVLLTWPVLKKKRKEQEKKKIEAALEIHDALEGEK